METWSSDSIRGTIGKAVISSKIRPEESLCIASCDSQDMSRSPICVSLSRMQHRSQFRNLRSQFSVSRRSFLLLFLSFISACCVPMALVDSEVVFKSRCDEIGISSATFDRLKARAGHRLEVLHSQCLQTHLRLVMTTSRTR